MTSLTWLHLSDLHTCTPKHAWDAGRVIGTLTEDLRRLQEDHGLRPDLLFFTGDAAFGQIGDGPEHTVRGQLERFASFLDAARGAFEPTIPLEDVFLVPGNHDVDRAWVTPDQTKWLADQEQEGIDVVRGMIHGGGLQWRRYMERLRDYRDFLTSHGFTHLLDDPERLLYSTVREIGKLRVGVAGFNSAWSCCRDGERGRLWMAGRWQQGVLRPKLDGADFSIALVHHPPDWLVEPETLDFGWGLQQDFRFLLHGHEHRAWVQSTDKGYTVIAAAACYERSDTERNGYNVVRLDPATGRGEVWLRRYEPAGGDWIPRVIAGHTDERGVRELCPDWLAELGRERRPPKPRAEDVAASPADAAEETDLSRYLRRLRSAHRDLPLAGFETRVRLPIRLDQVYMPLRARVAYAVMERDHKDFGALREMAAEAERDRDVAFDEALGVAKEHGLRGAVVLGDPGSGKTTLLKHFVLAATDPSVGPGTLGLASNTVPVVIELRRLRDPAAGLVKAIEEAVARADVALDAPAFTRELLGRHPLLVLLDGLDEVADASARAAVARWLDEAVQQLPESTFVVTSRYAGYKGESRLSGRFLELHVREVGEEQARRFLVDWYTAVESQAELGRELEVAEALAREAGEELGEKIWNPDDPRITNLKDLATNPLMLQILCLVHRDRKSLPEKRVELYRECVVVLLELWRRAKGMPVDLLASEAQKLLQPLAWRLHEEERKEARIDELLPHLEAPLRELRRPLAEGAALLEGIRDQSGVLVSLGQSEYGFLHLSFQEYLCARHVQDRGFLEPAILGELARRFGEAWWREVILLALGLDNPSLFEPLVEEILRREVLHRDVRLADDCLRDAHAATARPFVSALERGVEDDAERYHALRLLRVLPGIEEDDERRALVERLAREDPDPQVRGMAAEILGLEAPAVAGAERVHEKDASVLVFVPGGEYVLGADDVDVDSKPVHRMVLSPFWIGKYPVTHEQYGRFLEANPGQPEPEYWDDKQFNQPRQPVVGVGWEEARAYCRWAGLELPSEAQWEAAARGSDQRRYPWGAEEPTAELANFHGGEGRPSAVGSYPKGAGPFGTLDQAGNVREWCADVWDPRAYDGREGQTDPVSARGEAASRVVRGGSWARGAGNLPAALRAGSQVVNRLGGLGFRCVSRSGPST